MLGIGGNKLKNLIKMVRASKTAAEERAVVARECASIRSSFGENDNKTHQSNVTELIVIYSVF